VKTQHQYLCRGLSVLFAFVIVGAASVVRGQQTIFNVPTTDVLGNASNGNHFFLLLVLKDVDCEELPIAARWQTN
jgi:hypothetical protein